MCYNRKQWSKIMAFLSSVGPKAKTLNTAAAEARCTRVSDPSSAASLGRGRGGLDFKGCGMEPVVLGPTSCLKVEILLFSSQAAFGCGTSSRPAEAQINPESLRNPKSYSTRSCAIFWPENPTKPIPASHQACPWGQGAPSLLRLLGLRVD